MADGFHARRRADKEAREAARLGKLGLSKGYGETQPLPQEPDTPPAETPSFPLHDPARLDDKDPAYRPPLDQKTSDGGVLGMVPTLPPTKGRRKFNPPLQLMLGPILRYDTVVDHVYHAFAMIVTTDAGSSFASPPTLTLEWDPHGHEALEGALGKLKITDHHSDEQVERKTVEGLRIHTYHSLAGPQSFWRFKIEIPMNEQQMEIFYSVNGGPEHSFWVPAFDANFRWVAHSCNGFSAGVDTKPFNGPDPLWSDVLRAHESDPVHVLIGGGDQIYCDPLTKEPELADWFLEKDAKKKEQWPLTPDISFALDRFFFNWYCSWFRSGAFGRAIQKIPMLNQADDHDIIDGFGSYPDEWMSSPVFSAIGDKGIFYFLLFQMFIVDAVDGTSPSGPHPSKSLVIGGEGAYIPFPSHSFISYLGPKVYTVLLDTRTERKRDQIASKVTYERVFDALRALPAEVEHLVVLLGVPIAYPRMGAVETLLETSKFNPITAIAKTGAFGTSSLLNKFNGEAELLDDLNDHWCAKYHKEERNWFIVECQKLALSHRLRITYLSGDVHCAAVSKLYSIKNSNPATDPKYMLQVITSAIVNTPPPNAVLLMVSTFGKKRHKTLHHANTDEELIPLFKTDTDGTNRKVDTIMGRRNYAVVTYHPDSRDLEFDLRIEVTQGSGTTKGYPISAPAPAWQ